MSVPKDEKPANEIITGEQSQITELVLNICQKIPGSGLGLVRNIIAYQQSLEYIPQATADYSRTADQIMASGNTRGCAESGLVVATILRAKGEKALWVATFEKESIESYRKQPGETYNAYGHVFVKWDSPNGTRYINSTTGEVTENLPDRYVFGTEGLDAWDCGLKTPEDRTALFMKVVGEIK